MNPAMMNAEIKFFDIAVITLVKFGIYCTNTSIS
jgi:hypothetical protein